MSDDPIRVFVHGRAVLWSPPRRSFAWRALDWVAAYLCTRWAAFGLLLAVAAIVAGELARHGRV